MVKRCGKSSECRKDQECNEKMNGHAWSGKGGSRLKKSNGTSEQKRRRPRRALPKPQETEEEAIIRRFHDAQRMARFRARKKKALEEARALEQARFAELSAISELKRRNISFHIGSPVISVEAANREQFQGNLYLGNPAVLVPPVPGQSKYSQLLAVIEELGKDIRLTYAGSRISAERLKVGIVQARMLVKDCLLEAEINSR